MTDFQWRTDEEDGRWDTPPPEPAPDPAPDARRRWRRLVFVLGVIAIGVVAAVVVYRRAAAEVATAQAQIAADVVSGYEVVRRAAEGQDRELFTSVLSGRDDAWTDAMQNVVEEALLFDRPLLGLYARPAPSVSTDTVRLADDLQAAEIQVPVQYELDAGNGVTTTVTLAQTHLYRRGDDQRWLFAPPLDGFWEEVQEVRGQRLSAAFPGRDAQLVERLVADLDRKLEEACTLPDVGCPDNLRLNVIFSTDPDTLRAGASSEAWLEQLPPLRLPTPTLVGLPQDTAGYGALLRGYGRLLTRRLLADAAGYECCTAALFTQALLDYQLDQLKLQPWPLGRKEFVQLARDLEALENPLAASRMATFDWIYEGEAWIRAYATIQFLLSSTPDVTAGELLRLSQREREALLEERDLEQWLNFIGAGTRSEGDGNGGDGEWLLNTVCGATFENDLPPATLVQHIYNLAGDVSEMYQLPYGPAIGIPLPDARGLLLVEWSEPGLHYLSGPDAEPRAIERPAEITGVPIFVEPVPGLDRATVFYVTEGENSVPELGTVDLQACARGTCAVRPVPGYPSWSPDGRQGVTTGEYLLGVPDRAYLIDGAGQIVREIGGPGSRILLGSWLDEDQFVYVDRDTVYLEKTDESDRQPLFTRADVQSWARSRPVRGITIMALAGTPESLFVALEVNSNRLGGPVLLRIDLDEDTITEIDRIDTGVLQMGIDPTGRYLLLLKGNSEEIVLYTMEGEKIEQWHVSEPIPLERSYWSPDGQWLLLPGDALTRLLNVESGEYRFLPYGNNNGCLRSAWFQWP